MAEARDAAKNNDDNWKRIVELLTGYILPQRKTLFDTPKGNEGIPLMHVRLDKVGGSQHMPGFVQSGGWLRDKTDFVLPYYRLGDSGKDDPSEGSNLGHYKAHITFIGRAAGDTPPSGNVAVRGGEKTSKVLKEDGMWNKGDGEKISWDALPLMQYVHGSKAALDKIVLYPHSTQGFESRGISIPDDSYVDLLTFTEVAKSLDRVVKFFQDSAKTLEEWEAKDIGNGSMSWAGTSASLFKQLVHKMAKNYEGYAAQVGNNEGFVPVASADGETIGSAPGRALMDAQPGADLLGRGGRGRLGHGRWRSAAGPGPLMSAECREVGEGRDESVDGRPGGQGDGRFQGRREGGGGVGGRAAASLGHGTFGGPVGAGDRGFEG
ncbi:hypothetical protein QFZ82_000292 [Streptomyces sp. V4I23]|uniref:AAWKG family protein n=1 Tax=Streptomyces sp. V4I23 TaxID=3042282 RepID=UPI002787CA8B|nr:AAWKG family protein [Streptomyces sp. V4I23]MDQ1005807.1 hypothetical protein [Streptomyces sp. V4I23]